MGIDYPGSSVTNTWYHEDVSGNVAASAGGDPAHLLQVNASAYSPDPGVLGGPGSPLASATASWTNDAVTVTAPVGGTLPDAIRLNLTLTFAAPGQIPYAGLTTTYNGTTRNYSVFKGLSGPYDIRTDNTALVDSSTTTSNSNGSSATLKETFHIDLPLSKSGLSAPFSLGLQLSPSVGLVNGEGISYTGLTGNLALTGVTLPDGTSLAALGDSVSFESGLHLPGAVPEPASLLVWGLIAATAGMMAVRRARLAPGR